MTEDETDMNGTIIDRDVIRKYLLGSLDDDAILSRIEEELLTGDEFSSRLELAEHDLIEDYLDQELIEADVKQFDDFFLVSPYRRRQMELIRGLRAFPAPTGNSVTASERSQPVKYPGFFASWPRFAVFAAVLIAAGFGIWKFQSRQSDGDRGLAELRAAYRGQRIFEPRLTVFPEYSPVTLTRGESANAVDQDAHGRAERYLFDATRDNGGAHAYHNLALLYLADKKYDLSITEFQRAIAGAPDDPRLQSDAGAAYLQIALQARQQNDGSKVLESLDESLKHLEKAINIDPKMPEPRFNKAICLRELGTTEREKAAWTEYLEIDSTSRWADEARRRLQDLEKDPPRGVSAADAESQFLEAFRKGDDRAAFELISNNRELIREKYMPQRLAMSFVDAPPDRRPELLNALRYAGEIEMRKTGDPYGSEIAHFYASATDDQLAMVREAQLNVHNAYRLLLDNQNSSGREALQNAAAVFHQAGDEMESVLAAYVAAYALVNLEKSEAAGSEIRSVIDYARSKGYLWLEATALYWSGMVNLKLHRYLDSRVSYERAMDLAATLDDPYISQRNGESLANLYMWCGLRRASLSASYRALSEARSGTGSLRQRIRTTYYASYRLLSLDLPYAAAELGAEGYQMGEMNQDPLVMASSANYTGNAFTALGNVEVADQWLQRAVAAADAIPDDITRRRNKALIEISLGNLRSLSGDFGGAESSFSRALGLLKDVEMGNLVPEAQSGAIAAKIRLNKLDEAEQLLGESIRFAEKFRETIADEQAKSGLSVSNVRSYELAADLALRRGDIEAAYNEAEVSNSRSLLDWLERGAEVETQNGKPALQLPYSAKPMDASAIRAAMPADVAIVQYMALADRLVIWVVTTDKLISREVSIGSVELKAITAELVTSSLSRSGADDPVFRSGRRRLYDVLIGPVRQELGQFHKLCIVRSGVLVGFPFAVLTDDVERPLIADHEILYAPSANVFIKCTGMAAAAGQKQNESLLAIGDPAFDVKQFPGLAPLPSAEAEAMAIAGLYENSKVLVKSQATKDAVLRALPAADVVHLAGHYIAEPGSPMSSYLLLAKDGELGSSSMLTNAELAARPFTQTKLAVLAACSTAGDSYTNSEGAVGISSTLIGSRVPVIVASQWNVDSEATSVLMTRFHQLRKQEHLATTEALRRAQLEMLNDPTGRFSDPYYWAAFAVYGGFAPY